MTNNTRIVSQRAREEAQWLFKYAGFKFAADHLDMAMQATIEAFARFEEETLALSRDGEREACAKAAERIGSIFGEKPPSGERGTNVVWDTAHRIATAIRARSAPTPKHTREAAQDGEAK